MNQVYVLAPPPIPLPPLGAPQGMAWFPFYASPFSHPPPPPPHWQVGLGTYANIKNNYVHCQETRLSPVLSPGLNGFLQIEIASWPARVYLFLQNPTTLLLPQALAALASSFWP